jgi:hypothetical protein
VCHARYATVRDMGRDMRDTPKCYALGYTGLSGSISITWGHFACTARRAVHRIAQAVHRVSWRASLRGEDHHTWRLRQH